MKTTAVIFTYPRDYVMAGIAGRSLRNCGAKVYFAIDREDPRYHIDGGGLVVTSFPRKGNLNGMACALGILDTMAAVGGDSEWLIKVDSDTVVTSFDWLKDIPEHVAVVGTGLDPSKKGGRTLYGACYAVRRTSLPALRARLLERGDKITPCEDLMMGNAAESLGALHRYLLHQDKHFGPHTMKRTAEDLIERFHAVVVQRTGRHDTARDEVVVKMNELYTTRWGA